MNRDEAKKLIKIENKETYPYGIVNNVDETIDKIYDSFEKDLKEINNRVSRLKKQLSKGHHVECGCSFCKPVNNKVNKDLEDYNDWQ